MAEVFVNDTYTKSYFDAALSQTDNKGYKTTDNAWKSKLRKSTSTVTEVLTYEFAGRSSISSVAFDILSCAAKYSFSYIDSNKQEQPLLRDDYNKVEFTTISRKDWNTWQHWEFECLPCVALKLIVRMTRVNDDFAPIEDYSLALKGLAIKRSIKTRDQAALTLSKNTDILGNVISKTVKDWEPKNAIDGDDYTFWKSEPQPAQDAVVSLYLDVRDEYDQAQFVDSIWVDPVYMGSQLNIYYSTDDAEGNRLPSFKTFDTTSNNADWSDDGFSMHDSTSSIAFDLKQSAFNQSKDWFVGLHWVISSALPSGDRKLFSIGDRCFVTMRSDGKFQFSFLTQNGMQQLLLPFPVPILATDQDAVSPVLTDIVLEFGFETGSRNQAVIRAKINNYNLNDVSLSSATGDASMVLSTELSAIADGVDASTKVDGKVQLTSAPYEVAIPTSSTYTIPVDTSNIDIQKIRDNAGGSSVKAKVSIKYRTSADFNSGATAVVKSGLNTKLFDYYTSWDGVQQLSSSSLYSSMSKIATNYATGGFRISSDYYNKTFSVYDDALKMSMLSFSPSTSSTKVLGALEFSSRSRAHQDIVAGDYIAAMYVNCSQSLQNTPLSFDICRGGDVIVEASFNATSDVALIEVPVHVSDDIREAYFSVSMKNDSFVFSDFISIGSSMFFGLSSEWDVIKSTNYKTFNGDTKSKDAIEMSRFNQDLSLNSTMNQDGWQLGSTAYPKWGAGNPTNSYMSALSYGDNDYKDALPWIDLLPSSVFTVSFYCKSKNGFDNVKPYIKDSSDKKYLCEKYSSTDLSDSWRLIYCRIRMPSDFDNDIGSFGIEEDSANAYTVISDLHVYRSQDSFNDNDGYCIAERDFDLDTSSEDISIVDLDTLAVDIINYATIGTVYVSSASIQIFNDKLQPVDSYQCTIGQLSGTMKQFVMKQDSIPQIDKDKFVQDPQYYLTPDFYDSSSTLFNSLVYSKSTEEEAFRGGVSDAFYMNKLWMPAIIGEKLNRQNYRFSATVKAKFIKLEMTQLSPQQYSVQNTSIDPHYLAYPVSLTKTMTSTKNIDTTNVKTKTTVDTTKVVSKFEDGRQTSKKTYLSRDGSSSQSSSSTTNEIFSDPQEVISVGSPSQVYVPGMYDKPMSTSIKTEKTSSVIYTGQTKDVERSFNSNTVNGSRTTTKVLKHTSEVPQSGSFNYTIQSGDCLINIARKFGIANWWSIYALNTWVDGDPRLRYLPGRSAGWWIFPGQVIKIPTTVMKQITTYSTQTIVHKTSTKTDVSTVKTTVNDITTTRNTTIQNGSQGFTKPSVHYYEDRTVDTTSSIAYFVAIRELKVKVADYYYEQDNEEFDYYSMDMPIWHYSNGYVTTVGAFVPNLQDGEEKAVVQSDPTKTQSFFRTVQVLSSSSSTVLNRKYFDLKAGTAWHDVLFWEANPTQNCEWDGSIANEDNPANGQVWSSAAFSWGDAFTSTVTQGDSQAVWYNSELVKEYIVNPQDIRIAPDGSRSPFVIRLGSIDISDRTTVQAGVSIFQLVKSTRSDSKISATFKIVSAANEEKVIRQEDVLLDSEKTSSWQLLQTSRFKMFNMGGTYELLLEIDDFSQLDFYIKDAYIETGTITIFAKNTGSSSETDWEDISSAVLNPNSEYTFKNAGNAMQVRIEMIDPEDWFSSIRIMPTYIPFKDAVNYIYDDKTTIDTSYDNAWLGSKDYSASHLQISNDGEDYSIANLAKFSKPATNDIMVPLSAASVVNDSTTESGTCVEASKNIINALQVDSTVKTVIFLLTDTMSAFDYSNIQNSSFTTKFSLRADTDINVSASLIMYADNVASYAISTPSTISIGTSWHKQSIHAPAIGSLSGRLALKLDYSDSSKSGIPASISFAACTVMSDSDQAIADRFGIDYFDGDTISAGYQSASSRWLGSRDSSISTLKTSNPRLTSFWSGIPEASYSVISKNYTVSNLLQNSSFEQDLSNWSVSNQGLVQIDDGQHHDGAKSLKFSSRTGVENDYASSDSISVIPGHKYAMSFFAKTDSDNASDDLVRLSALDDGDVVSLNDGDFKLLSANGWQEFVAYCVPNSTTMSMRLEFFNNKLESDRSIWCDDAKVVDLTFSDAVNLFKSPSMSSLEDFGQMSGTWAINTISDASWCIPYAGKTMLRAKGGDGSYSIQTKPFVAASSSYHLSFYANAYDSSRKASIKILFNDGSVKDFGAIKTNSSLWQRNDYDFNVPATANSFSISIYNSADIRYDAFILCSSDDWVSAGIDGAQWFDGNSYGTEASNLVTDPRCTASWNNTWQAEAKQLPGYGIEAEKTYGKQNGTVSATIGNNYADGSAIAVGDTIYASCRIMSSTGNSTLLLRVVYSDSTFSDTNLISSGKVSDQDRLHRLTGFSTISGDTSKTIASVKVMMMTDSKTQFTECLIANKRDWNLMKSAGIQYFDGDKIIY
jgi:hypothetical protein